MNRSKATALRAVVLRMDKAFCNLAAGLVPHGRTLGLIQASCDELRAAGLDELSEHYLGVMERSMRRLRRAHNHPNDMPPSEDAAAGEIELLKSIWRLDAHLCAIAAGEPVLSRNTETTSARER